MRNPLLAPFHFRRSVHVYDRGSDVTGSRWVEHTKKSIVITLTYIDELYEYYTRVELCRGDNFLASFGEISKVGMKVPPPRGILIRLIST